MKAATVTKIKQPSTSPAGTFALDPATTLVRIGEVIASVVLARPTGDKQTCQAESGFPLPVKLSDSNSRGAPVAWVLGEVQEWVRARIAARGKVAA